MKRIIILAVVFFAVINFNAEAKKYYNGVSGYFYSQLSPYGSWIEVDYGVVVWRPTIIRVNWTPYQVGRWVWTYDGWYWDSYESFGFITYHYGRWFYDDYYGWLWYPDYEWAPAWVEWRYSNNYIGWAPLHPYAAFSVSVGIYFTNTYYTPYNYWNYVTYVNFCDPYVYNYYVSPASKYRIHSGTKTRYNFVYYNGRIQNRGVDVEYVRSRSGNEIKQRDILRVNDSRELSRDGSRNRDEIRTLDLNRDVLTRNDLSRMEIKRENRKTSVDMEKVKIGRIENSTNIKRNDKSNDRSLNVEKSNRTKNVNTRNSNLESTRKETNRTNTQIDSRKKDEQVVRNEKQIRQQKNINSNESLNVNKKREEQTNQIKKEDTRTRSNSEVNQKDVRVQNKKDDQKSREKKSDDNNDNVRGKSNSRDRNKK